MSEDDRPAYQVLARKYRPETFADLVGQDAMVRTLRNAFAADRIAQAFILTGIRGTGKTTTARIIAKGLNCVGPDGTGGPTTEPCGQCEPCVAIAEGRHVDVMEMDAASRTGVGDIREIIDSVHYRAASARYKIYIIDEVHMLSTNAFNALLKTLEEPPAHVKFIFATTEIRKVPVTVLSRCQRFDLRRIEPETMLALLRRIADAEGGAIGDEALALITRAAEGSARDATSLLDQALNHGGGTAGPAEVRAMLGLADRGRVMDLFTLIMRGDAAGALNEIATQYADGADPMAVLRDLAELTHWISVVQISPETAEDPTIAPDERQRGQTLAGELPMPVLTRAWQMLLRSLEEAASAPNAMMAAEMAIIRLTHVADLPTPGDLVRRLTQTTPPPAGGGGQANGGGNGGGNGAGTGAAGPASARLAMPGAGAQAGRRGEAGAVMALAEEAEPALARYVSFDQVIALVRHNRDVKLLVDIEDGVMLASYSPGRIAFQPAPGAAPDLAQRLAGRLQSWTGVRWGVSLVNEGGAPTIAETRNAERLAEEAELRALPLVQAVMAAFPGTRIGEIRRFSDPVAAADADALAPVPDEWDPFEED